MAVDRTILDQVELLVHSGVVAEGQRDTAIAVLHASATLREISLGRHEDGLGDALARLADAVEAVRRERASLAALIAELEPLNNDARLMEAFATLHHAFQRFDEACASLSVPLGVPGAVIAECRQRLADALKEMKRIVGP